MFCIKLRKMKPFGTRALLFSYAGMVLEKKRGSMMPDHASEILFVRENLFLLAFQLDW